MTATDPRCRHGLRQSPRALGSHTAFAATLGLGLALCACSSSPAAQPRASYPAVGSPPAAPGTPPAALVGAPVLDPSLRGMADAATGLTDAMADLPCPPPGLPPELSRLIDCAASRRVSDAVAFVPQPINIASLPGAVDLRATNLTGPVKNQEQVGACAGFAVSTVLDNAARRFGRSDVVAPLHIYATYSGHGLNAVEGKPMTSEPVWPYDPVRACRLSAESTASGCGDYYHVTPGSGRADPRLTLEHANADRNGVYRIDRFEEMKAPYDMGQIAGLLAQGEAVWASLAFERSAWESEAVGRTGYLPYYPVPSDRIGHAVALEGYRIGPNGREYLFQNSWGRSWGEQGYAWIPESMLRSHMLYAYRLRVSLASASPWPGPSSSGSAPAIPWPTLPPAWQLPAGFGLPAGVKLPPGLELPAGVQLPAGLPWPFAASR
jgi:hypothetical protein